MSAEQNLPEFARRLVNLASPRLGSQAVFGQRRVLRTQGAAA
jgi:allantoicase